MLDNGSFRSLAPSNLSFRFSGRDLNSSGAALFVESFAHRFLVVRNALGRRVDFYKMFSIRSILLVEGRRRGGVQLAEAGAALARPAHTAGLSGRLEHRYTGNMTRVQGACWTAGDRSSTGRQARHEACGTRSHEKAVVERRKARIPDRKGIQARFAKRVGPLAAAPGARKPCVFRRSAPLAGEPRRHLANPGRSTPRKREAAAAHLRRVR